MQFSFEASERDAGKLLTEADSGNENVKKEIIKTKLQQQTLRARRSIFDRTTIAFIRRSRDLLVRLRNVCGLRLFLFSSF